MARAIRPKHLQISVLVAFVMVWQLHGSCLALTDRRITSSILRNFTFPHFKQQKGGAQMTLLGSASIDPDSGIIQIPEVQAGSYNLSNQAGKALYSSPLRMVDPETRITSSFHTTFSFRIDTALADSAEFGSSGLTFLIIPDEVTVGRAGGWLGMMNDACDENYKPFAVEFDTFKNDEFEDPNDNHVGVNLGSIVSNHTADAAAAGVSFRDGSTIRAWIRYDGIKRWIDVRIARDGNKKPAQPLIFAPLDLAHIFKEYMFVGFSAATGSTAQVHRILSWNFSSEAMAMLRFPKEKTCEKRLIRRRLRNKHAPSAFIIFSLVMLVILISLLNLACMPHKKDEEEPVAKLVLKKSRPRPLHRPRRFSLAEILEATRAFSEGEVLGYGARSIFFKGMLCDGSQVAIKRFSPQFLQLCLDHRKLMKEVGLITRLHHPNLVPLRGWCHDKRELLLVYEYMPNGSLDKWLHARGVLPWARRHKVVREIATALAYLHGGWEKAMVHKDVRTSNVLLDITFRARLGDFGLLQQTTDRMKDYSKGKGRPPAPAFSSCKNSSLPPESVHVREATAKMDVYSFGVMVLEIVSGRMPMEDDYPAEEIDLVEWAWNLQKEDRLLEVVDKKLGPTRYSLEQVICLLHVGLLCTLPDPRARPSMDMVVRYSSGMVALPLLPKSRPEALVLAPEISRELCTFMNSCSPTEFKARSFKKK